MTETEATPVASVTGTETEMIPFSYTAEGVTEIEKLLSAGGAVSTTAAADTKTEVVALAAL